MMSSPLSNPAIIRHVLKFAVSSETIQSIGPFLLVNKDFRETILDYSPGTIATAVFPKKRFSFLEVFFDVCKLFNKYVVEERARHEKSYFLKAQQQQHSNDNNNNPHLRSASESSQQRNRAYNLEQKQQLMLKASTFYPQNIVTVPLDGRLAVTDIVSHSVNVLETVL